MITEQNGAKVTFVRAVFRLGGREYTYRVMPDHGMEVGCEALTNTGKTVVITAVDCEGAVINGKPLGLSAYSFLARKPPADLRSAITTPGSGPNQP